MADDEPVHRLPIQQLTSRMLRGDEEAYREFYGLYGHRLFRYLIVVTSGQEERSKDALQQTLLRVVRHIRRFDSEEEFWSWLTVLARSAATDQKRRELSYLTLLGRFSTQETLEDAAHHCESTLNEHLQSSLNTLPEEDRRIVDLKYAARVPVKEIAVRLNTTEKAIESRLVRLRQRLKTAILDQLKHEDAT